MRKITMGIVAALALAVPAASAMAGYKENHYSVSASSIYGSIGAFRNAADPDVRVACWVNASGVGGCLANDAANVQRSCSTTNATHIANIRAINPASYVYVSISNGTCTAVQVTQASYNAVPVP